PLGSNTISRTHLGISNTWEEQTLSRVVGERVAVVKLPRTITVPLHVAPLRGWKLGPYHAAGHVLLGSYAVNMLHLYNSAVLVPLSSALLRQARHSIILIASGIPRLCCKGVSTINLPSLER